MKTLIIIIATSLVTILLFNNWIAGIYKAKYAECKKYKSIPFDDYAKKLKNEVAMYKYLQDLKTSCEANELTLVMNVIKYYNDLTEDDN